MTKPKNKMPMSKKDFTSMLGEGFHTAFRKGTSAPQANYIWKSIQKMDPKEWAAVLEYVTWGFEVSYGLTWPT